MSELLAIVVGASLVTGPPRQEQNEVTARIETAQVFFLEEVQVPAQESGVLVAVEVQAGDAVAAGAVLGKVDDRKPQLAKSTATLEHTAALAKAQDDIEIEYAIASHEVAQSDLRKDLKVNQRAPGAVPETDIEHKRLAEHRARLQIDRSRLDQRVAELSADVHRAAVAAADDAILRCRITAPFEGYVTDVLKRGGEWVDAGQPVVRLVRLDHLLVDGLLDAAAYDSHEIERRPVTVTVQLARGRRAEFRGRVVFVNPQVQAGNKYRVRAEVQNRQENGSWVLRPGLPASMTIHLDGKLP